MGRKPIAAFITDLHLKEDNIEVNKSIYKQSIAIAKGLGLNTIYGLGDCFESRKAQTVLLLNTFGEILNFFVEENMQLITCVGNHDKASYRGEESFLDEFRYHPNFSLVRTFERFNLTPNIDLHLLSFFHEKETYPLYYSQMLEEHSALFGKAKHNVLGTHIGINGSMMNSGEVIHESIETSDFDYFDLTLVGHFHDYQELNGGKIKYIGSAMQHNFGENENKGITILYDDLSTELIKLDFPEYHKYEINVEHIDASVLKEICDAKKDNQANIRVIVTGDSSKTKAFDRSILTDLGVDCKIKSNEVIVAMQAAQNNEYVTHTKGSILVDFDEFCATNEIADNTYGLEKLKSI